MNLLYILHLLCVEQCQLFPCTMLDLRSTTMQFLHNISGDGFIYQVFSDVYICFKNIADAHILVRVVICVNEGPARLKKIKLPASDVFFFFIKHIRLVYPFFIFTMKCNFITKQRQRYNRHSSSRVTGISFTGTNTLTSPHPPLQGEEDGTRDRVAESFTLRICSQYLVPHTHNAKAFTPSSNAITVFQLLFPEGEDDECPESDSESDSTE